MNSSPVHRRLMRLNVLSIVFIFSGLVAIAQQPTPTLEPGAVPNAPTLEPAMQATAAVLEAAWIADYESRSIFDFNIAYLIAPDAFPADNPMSEELFAETFGAEIVHSWDDFVIQNEQYPFQILLIHDSIYDQLDVTWTQEAYRNKVIIVGLGMPFEHFVEVTGNRCARHPNPHLQDDFASQMLSFSYVLSLENEDYRDLVDEALLTKCRKNSDVRNIQYNVMQGRTNRPLTSTSFLRSLVETLIFKTIDYEIEGTKSID